MAISSKRMSQDVKVLIACLAIAGSLFGIIGGYAAYRDRNIEVTKTK